MIFINILTCIELNYINSRLANIKSLTEQQKIEILYELQKFSQPCKPKSKLKL